MTLLTLMTRLTGVVGMTLLTRVTLLTGEVGMTLLTRVARCRAALLSMRSARSIRSPQPPHKQGVCHA